MRPRNRRVRQNSSAVLDGFSRPQGEESAKAGSESIPPFSDIKNKCIALPQERQPMTSPTTIESYCTAKVPASARFSALFSPYELKVLHGSSGEYSLLGRGSAGVIPSIHTFGGLEKDKPLVQVGNFCQTASGCALLAGGEHRNELVFNNSLRSFPFYQQSMQARGGDYFRNYSKGTITLGHNVTLSHGVVVVSGVTIGDGAVIGAGSVVTRNIPAFAIAAGNPARVIKYRFPEKDIEKLKALRWWDFETGPLLENLELFGSADVEAVVAAAREKAIAYAAPAGRLCFAAGKKSKQTHFDFMGVEAGGHFIKPESLPKGFMDYVNQANAPEEQPLHLSHTIFKQFKI